MLAKVQTVFDTLWECEDKSVTLVYMRNLNAGIFKIDFQN